MNTSYFIAKRIAKGGKKSNRFSKPIVIFATAGIALGMIVMILSVSIVTGFQSEIRKKVVGFGSHVQITNGAYNLSYESSPMYRDQPFLSELGKLEQVRHIQSYAIKPGIIRSNKKNQESNGKSSNVRDIQGIIVKGVDSNYDWSFIESRLEKGSIIPCYSNHVRNDSIIISRYIANKLGLKLFDPASTFFIKESGPKERKFTISGIYNTGLEDFDKQFLFADIGQIQELNLWGIESSLKMSPKCTNGGILIEAKGFSEHKHLLYSWNNQAFTDQSGIVIYPTRDTVIQVVIGGFTKEEYGTAPSQIVEPDTSYLSIRIDSDAEDCLCSGEENELEYEGVNDSTLIYHFKNGTVTTVFSSTPGTRAQYVGGFEVLLHDFQHVQEASKLIQGEMLGMFTVSTIDELHSSIFGWLEMLDANVYVIIVLMLIVAIINMTTALLILILERSNMIGVLKAMGAVNWGVQKIFLINGSILTIKGLLIGNGIALLVILLQNQFGFIKLDQSTYFLEEVPMYFTPGGVVLLNAFTLIVCTLVLLIPTLFVTRITPIKAIRFD